uniref:Tetraspanin n=1 Tax=Panagrellus redivivus TaxID=6233 RepID=A0A7E4VZ63_PANRE
MDSRNYFRGGYFGRQQPREYSYYPETFTPAPPYYSKAPPSNQDSCRNLSKYVIYACNILYTLVGAGTLALGIWLRTDSRFRDFISERYRQAVDGAFWQAPTLFVFSYILIILGATMIVVAFIGCCGVVGGSRLFLGFYAGLLFMLLIFTISCGVYILYRQNGIEVELSDALNYMVQHYYQGPSIVQEALDRLQQAFRCCGNAGCSDFEVFRQDPPRTCDIRCDGCHYRIMIALQIGFSVAVVVYGICILAEIVDMSITFVLLFRNDQKKNQKPVYLFPSREEYEREMIAMGRRPIEDPRLQQMSHIRPQSRTKEW